MSGFLHAWGEAATTTLGFFWMALWAFALGYAISAMIQVFVTEERMKRTMGEAGAKSVGLATVFGFLSSSCSFAALATTKSLYKKGAGLVPSLAFLLASTNLVIELGIVIAVFLSWHFVVGEYVGGLLLIAFMWVLVKLTATRALEEDARAHLTDDDGHEDEVPSWKARIASREGWAKVGHKYLMEWKMVWKDVTFGFTIAGVIAAFVPSTFFETLFVGAGSGAELGFGEVVLQTLVGPVAAFFTFIGSMGNIPLAALLYDHGVSFAGVMAFIFSDLVVFPVLRIHASYYGWKMALYVLGVLLAALVGAALVLHYGFDWAGAHPSGPADRTGSVTGQTFFAVDHTLVLNLVFLALSATLAWLWHSTDAEPEHGEMAQKGALDRVLTWLALGSYVWVAGGLVAHFLADGSAA